MNWWTEGHGSHQDIKVQLGSPPFGTIVPQQWRYRYYRGSWYGWTGYDSFNREQSSRIHTGHYSLTYGAFSSRTVQVEVKWTDPTNSSKVLVTSYQKAKTSGFPVPK